MKYSSISRSATILAILAALSFAPMAHAEEPAITSPTRALGDILDCLAEALNGDAVGPTLLASADARAAITRVSAAPTEAAD